MNGFLSKIRSKKASKSSPAENGCSSTECSPQNGDVSGLNIAVLDDEKAHRIQRFARSTSIMHTLTETMRDAGALPYFIQFMDSLGQLHLIKFLLHVDGFRASATSAASRENNNADLVQLAKDDAGSIYAQYVCVDGASNLKLPEDLRKTVIDRVCAHDGSIDAGSFDEAYEYVKKILDDRYFKQFLHTVYYNKHLIDVLRSGSLSLSDVLKTQLLLCCFIEFLDAENARCLLEFLIAAESFCEEVRECVDDAQALDDAMIIYDKFFSMQATDPLHMGDKVRMAIEQQICTNSGRPDPNCFKHSMRIAVVSLQQNYISKFIQSQPFSKILNELISSVACYIDVPDGGVPKRASMGSSSRVSDSFPTLATYEKRHSDYGAPCDIGKTRARLGSASGSRLLSTADDDVFDDSVSQCSSNSAFATPHFRRNKSGMSLAKVDEFGRYSPLYATSWNEPESHSAREKIRNTLDKYLNQSTAKERQIADQVAQLIISDVHNMVSDANNLAMGSSPSLHRS